MVVGKEEFEIEREFKQGQNETFLLKNPRQVLKCVYGMAGKSEIENLQVVSGKPHMVKCIKSIVIDDVSYMFMEYAGPSLLGATPNISTRVDIMLQLMDAMEVLLLDLKVYCKDIQCQNLCYANGYLTMIDFADCYRVTINNINAKVYSYVMSLMKVWGQLGGDDKFAMVSILPLKDCAEMDNPLSDSKVRENFQKLRGALNGLIIDTSQKRVKTGTIRIWP